MDYVGTLDGEPFAGGEGRDQMIELGSGRLVPGLRGAAHRRRAPARSARSTSPSPTTTAPRSSPARTAEFAVTVKEVKAKELPPVDDDLADRGRLRHARRAARRHPRAAGRGRGAADRGRVPRDGARRRGRQRDGRGARRARRGARRASCGTRCCTRSAHQGISKEIYLQISGRSEEEIVDEGKADAERQLKREAVLAAVVEAEGDRADRGGAARGARARPPPRRARARRSCSSGCGPPAASTPSRPTSRSARRSTCWPSPRRRSRSSRRRRATSSGPPARTPGERPAAALDTGVLTPDFRRPSADC